MEDLFHVGNDFEILWKLVQIIGPKTALHMRGSQTAQGRVSGDENAERAPSRGMGCTEQPSELISCMTRLQMCQNHPRSGGGIIYDYKIDRTRSLHTIKRRHSTLAHFRALGTVTARSWQAAGER